MLDVLRPIQNLVQASKVNIDGRIFRLHYSFTVLVLLTFCVLMTAKQYVGDPILCSPISNAPESLLNTYCWIHATYTLANTSIRDVYPGIGSSDENNDLKYHKYYQWVCFVLFLQALTFYFPRWLWVQAERGVIKSVSFETSDIISDEKTRQAKNGLLVDYLINNIGYNDCYMLKYYACELLAFVNVIGQMFLLDRLLNGEFLKYGIEVLEYNFRNDNNNKMVDPMAKVFPRVSTCTFYNFGPSGGLQKLDILCLLPLNIVNEKIFIFLWFWFIILGFLTALLIVYRSILVSSVKIRFYVLAMRFCPVRKSYLETLVTRLSMGDWFFLYMLGQNIHDFRFNEIIAEYAKAINTRNKKAKS